MAALFYAAVARRHCTPFIRIQGTVHSLKSALLGVVELVMGSGKKLNVNFRDTAGWVLSVRCDAIRKTKWAYLMYSIALLSLTSCRHNLLQATMDLRGRRPLNGRLGLRMVIRLQSVAREGGLGCGLSWTTALSKTHSDAEQLLNKINKIKIN